MAGWAADGRRHHRLITGGRVLDDTSDREGVAGMEELLGLTAHQLERGPAVGTLLSVAGTGALPGPLR
jgi:hypothetical protein